MPVSHQIERLLLVFPESDRNGFHKELNLISWNNRKAKIDLRGWNENHTQMTKGITLTEEEFKYLKDKIGGIIL